MLVQILFYAFATVLVLSALGVIIARNPVHSALALVMCFLTSAAIWLLIGAEFLAVVLVLVYVGAVMVLFLFVVMMLDINIEELRIGFTRFAWLGWLTALVVILEIVGVVAARTLRRRCDEGCDPGGAGGLQQHRRARTRAVHAVCLSLRARGHGAAGCDHRRDHPDDAQAPAATRCRT